MPTPLRELMKHPDFWSLVKTHEANPHDQTPAKIFADWLDEHGAPHYALIARHHIEETDGGYTPHPESVLGVQPHFVHGSMTAGVYHGTPGGNPARSRRVNEGVWPGMAYTEKGGLPVLHWQIPLPKGLAVFKAPITREQFVSFVRQMPKGKVRNQWGHFAGRHGWLPGYDTTGTKKVNRLKLARGTPAAVTIETLARLQDWPSMMRAETHHGVFGDWLEDQGRPDLAIIARNHKEPDHAHVATVSGHSIHSRGIDPVWSIHLRHRADDSPHLTWVVGGRDGTRSFEAPLSPDQFRQFLTARYRTGLAATKSVKEWAAHGVKQGWLGGKRPSKLARQNGMAAGIGDAGSEQAVKRRELALQILREAGLTPNVVKQVLAHEAGGKGIRSALLQLIAKRVHPARVRYAAAWYGLLSGEKKLTVFHPHDKGDDVLHILTTTVPQDQVAGYLEQSGLSGFSLDGQRAYVYDPKGSLSARMPTIAGGLHASHSAVRGFGYRLGSGPGSDADARANYRDTIRSYESVAGLAPDTGTAA